MGARDVSGIQLAVFEKTAGGEKSATTDGQDVYNVSLDRLSAATALTVLSKQLHSSHRLFAADFARVLDSLPDVLGQNLRA